MATTLNAQAGPSKYRQPSPKIETPSPINIIDDPDELREITGSAGRAGNAGISRNGLSVDENGEVTKVPPFLTKLYKWVSSSLIRRAVLVQSRKDLLIRAAWYQTPRRMSSYIGLTRGTLS